MRLHPYLVLDRPDELTRSGIRNAAEATARATLIEVDFGNLGASRSAGIAHSQEEIVFFLDGDDFVSFNWFENALAFFREQGTGGYRLIAHTEFFVGFDKERFVRVGIDSRDRSFDPLSLAADWFFCNNLACHRAIFDDVPIEPYDHASGFGAEDWHWSCETIARGYAHVLIPDTSYYYRVKPAKFSLGAASEVIPRKSALFEPQFVNSLPEIRAEADRGPLPILGESFFRQAERLVSFDYGISYLRSIRTKPGNLHYFRPAVPDLVGQLIREYCAGQQSSDFLEIVFADAERLPGGLDAIERVLGYLSSQRHAPGQPMRLYVLDGDPNVLQDARELRVIRPDRLRTAGVNEAQIAKLVTRPFIQNASVQVYNFISPRRRSLAPTHALAKRHSVTRWQNIILEYGFDRLSNTAAEFTEIVNSGIPSQTIAIFEKTAREFSAGTGHTIAHSSRLEHIFAPTGADGECSFPANGYSLDRLNAISSFHTSGDVNRSSSETKPAAQFRMLDTATVELVGDELGSLSGKFIYLVLGQCRPSAEMLIAMREASARPVPTIAVPALIVWTRDRVSSYFRPDIGRMNAESAAGTFPTDLLHCPVLGFDTRTLMAASNNYPSLQLKNDRLRISTLFRIYFRSQPSGQKARVVQIARNGLVSCTDEDMAVLGRPGIVREMADADGLKPVGEA
jgi:hypothetical protein